MADDELLVHSFRIAPSCKPKTWEGMEFGHSEDNFSCFRWSYLAVGQGR